MKTARRVYRMSDDELTGVSRKILLAAKADLAKLATQGVTQEVLDSINTDMKAFNNCETDEELMCDVMECVDNRNGTRDILKQKIIEISSKAKLKFGADSTQYRLYGIHGVSRSTPSELVTIGRRLAKITATQLAELADCGLTQAGINALKACADLLETQIDLQLEAIINRSNAVENRTKLGNELYKRIVNLAAKGKICWQFNRLDKYSLYVITEPAPAKTQTLSGSIGAQKVVAHDLAGIKSVSKIKVQNTGEAALTMYFATEPTNTTAEKEIRILPGGTTVFSASQAGYNKDEGFVYFNVFNAEMVKGVYKIRWG